MERTLTTAEYLAEPGAMVRREVIHLDAEPLERQTFRGAGAIRSKAVPTFEETPDAFFFLD